MVENKIGTEVSLNEIEQRLCVHVAKVRYAANRDGGVKNALNSANTFDVMPTFEVDLEGYGAEVAFCKLFNVYPDFSFHLRDSERDFGDARLACGRVVDVKSTKYKTGRLLAPLWKNDAHDLYALMIGVFPTYKFVGFMKREDLRREERIGFINGGKAFLAPQEELKELKQLEEIT